jgi:Antimicrobial peptide resistance and lipid A acylation protein PagP
MKKSNILISCIVTILVALPISPAIAGKFNAVLNGKSYHFNSTYDWNNNNFGLGIEHEFDSQSAWRTTVMANGFRDSTDNMSYMAGAGLHRRLFETEQLSGFYISAGLNAFVMTRDDVDSSKPFPGILPSVSIGNEKIGFNLTYLPRQAVEVTTQSQIVDPTISGILFVQFKVSLDQLLP